jgi:hypothetical protein
MLKAAEDEVRGHSVEETQISSEEKATRFPNEEYQKQKRPLTFGRSGGRLELRKPIGTAQVRQSFSHGRSKTVTVEVRKKRPLIVPTRRFLIDGYWAVQPDGVAIAVPGPADVEEAQRKAVEEEARREAVEEEARRRAAQEEARREAAEEEARRKAAEEESPHMAEKRGGLRARQEEERASEAVPLWGAETEARLKAAAEEAQRKITEEEAQRKAAEVSRRRAALAAAADRRQQEVERAAEEERLRAEAEARREAEAEARREAEAEARREAEAEARRKAEAEARRKAEAEARREAEAEARREAEAEARREAEAEARREAEAEARRKAEAEARKPAEEARRKAARERALHTAGYNFTKEFNSHQELNGAMAGFGVRFWRQIMNVAPEAATWLDRRQTVTGVYYSDQYIKNPLTVGLLYETLYALPRRDIAGQHIPLTVWTQILFKNKSSVPSELCDDWHEPDIRNSVLRSLMEREGYSVSIEDGRELKIHYRFLRIETEEGSSLLIRLDNGLGYWKVFGKRPSFDFGAVPETQARALRQIDVGLRVGAFDKQGATPVVVKLL